MWSKIIENPKKNSNLIHHFTGDNFPKFTHFKKWITCNFNCSLNTTLYKFLMIGIHQLSFFQHFKIRTLNLKCPRFSDVRQSFMSRFVKLVPNMKYLSDPDRLIYMLSCEGESARLVSRFLLVVLSAQRSSFVKLWRELNNPGGDMH